MACIQLDLLMSSQLTFTHSVEMGANLNTSPGPGIVPVNGTAKTIYSDQAGDRVSPLKVCA